MTRRDVILRAALVLLVVWACVWGVRAYAGSRKITAERVNREVAAARFADWSAEKSPPDAAEARRRDKELRKIATLVNRLDFQEREKNRENRTGEAFFRRLSPDEKGLFIDLTIRESMGHFMEALDAMKPGQRKKFVEQGLKEISDGRTGADMARADELGSDLLDKISEEGMKAYFEKSSADTKLDLAPLMEAMNETMQGLRGNEFGPRRWKQHGFTLIELLVVIGIIGALAAIIYPISRSVVGKSREAACLANLRSLGVGLQSYLQDHNDKMPELVTGRSSKTEDVPVLETVLLPYLETPEAFHCPADQREFQKSGSSYLWNATQSGRHVSQLALFGIKGRPDKIPLIYEKEAWHPHGMNFLYADMSSSNKLRFATGN